MKTNVRLLLTALLMLACGMNVAVAQGGWSTNTFEADGIQYYLNNTTHEAKIALGNYSGEMVIPEYIWPEHPGSQDALVQINNPYWGGFRVTDYVYTNTSGAVQTPFSDNANITKVTLPPSVRAIRDGLFTNCTQLEEVRLLGCFFTNSYATDTQSPTDQSRNVFSGCTGLRRLYADDPRVVCVRRKVSAATGKWEDYCPLVSVLGTNTTANLALYHNAGVKLASYFPNRIVKQELTTLASSKLQVTLDFFPNGNVSYIDYGYTLSSLFICNVTETSHNITGRQMAIDCPKQGCKTFVLRNVPADPNVSFYLKPYIQVGDAEPVPMCIFGDTFYYTVYANPDANSNTNVNIFYKSSATWGAGLNVETPGNITVYIDNQRKISDYQEAGNYNVASPEHPYSTYEVALDFDTLRYVVKAYDAKNNEYALQKRTGGYTNGVYNKGKYSFRTTGSASYLDYRVRLTATDIPMRIWYYGNPTGARLTLSGYRGGVPFTFTHKNSKYLFTADPEKELTLKLDNVRDGVVPYIIAAQERLELQEGTNPDGTKYHQASYVPHYGANNDVQIGTTQIIENGTLLSVNITKVGNGYVWISETNDWYEPVDDDNPEQLEDMEADGEMQSFEWEYDIDDIQTLQLVVPISESTNGIVETVRVNVNGADVALDHVQESGNHDGEMWYYYKVPINGDLDIQIIHETNGRHLAVKNGDGSGQIEIYNPEDEEVLSVATDQATSGEYLVRQAGYYALIQPRAGKEVSAIFTSGMQQLLPPSNYLLDDGTYLVPLAGFETNTTSEYQLSVLYADGTVEPWISYHHEGLTGSLGTLVDALPNSQKHAIEQLAVSMNMRAKDLAAIRYLGGKPNYYTKPDTQGSLYSLDLTDASFNESDEVFYTDESREYKINTHNVMPQGFLAGMHLETLYLPKALQGFEEGALTGVNRQLVVYAPWKTPLDLSTSSGFGDEVAQMWLYVPAGSFDAYAADAEWGKFGFISEYGTIAPDIIEFADANVKAICVENWDTDGDGELSKAEAAAVTTLKKDGKSVFSMLKEKVTSFDEFQYFTGLTTIEASAFSQDSIRSIVLPPSIKTIQDEGLAYMRVAELVVPEGVTSIGNRAFANNPQLEHIRLPKSLTSIGYSAFNNTALHQIYIPENVSSIGAGANIFAGCQKLTSVVVDPNNATYSSRNNCSAIIEKASGGDRLVYGCAASIIPEGVVGLQIQAFGYSGVKNVVIPASVREIKIAAFTATQLDTLEMRREEPIAFNWKMFNTATDTPSEIANCVLVVPYGTKDAYAEAGWKSAADGGCFKQVIESTAGIKGDVNNDGQVDVSDYIGVANIILNKPSTSTPQQAPRKVAADVEVGTMQSK